MKFCPKIQSKFFGKTWNKEEFDKKTEEYQEKFEKLVIFIEEHQRFPEFDNQILDDFRVKNMKILDFFPFWHKLSKNRWFYDKNFIFFNNNYCTMMQNKELQKDKMILKWHEFCIESLEYQRKYMVLPTRAKWFNDNSEIIFQYLENFKE